MGDPVQVVAEALAAHRHEHLCIRRGDSEPDAPIDDLCKMLADVEAPAAVAALQAAGALMPLGAKTLRDTIDRMDALHREHLRSAADDHLARQQLTALLQEVREVLGRHSRLDDLRYGCDRCGYVWPCPEASLAERIEKVLGGEG